MHLGKPPWLPRGLRALWEDYRALARARLQELGEEAGGPIPTPSPQAQV